MLIEVDVQKMDPESARFLGFALEKGNEGFVKDYEKAYVFYAKAALEGDALAMNNLGWLYENGLGCDVNLRLAADYYKQAAELNCTTAMINLGNMCENNEEYEEALEWYHEAALLGDSKGLFNYANMFPWGWGVEQDYKKAYKYFSVLAERDYEGVAFYMGMYAEEGLVGKPNPKLALYYYDLGARADDAYCVTHIARMFALGIGLDKDEERAFDLYQQAAKMGDELAFANLGYCYETGQGVEKNIEKAKEMYSIGASLGEEHAIEELERLENDGI